MSGEGEWRMKIYQGDLYLESYSFEMQWSNSGRKVISIFYKECAFLCLKCWEGINNPIQEWVSKFKNNFCVKSPDVILGRLELVAGAGAERGG